MQAILPPCSRWSWWEHIPADFSHSSRNRCSRRTARSWSALITATSTPISPSAVHDPTVKITEPTEGQSVPEKSLVQVQTLLTDDNGIGNVDYYSDGSFFSADGDQIKNIAPKTYTSQVFWDTTGLTPIHQSSLKAKAANIDDDQTESAPVGVVVRAGHCFNKIKDDDEVDVGHKNRLQNASNLILAKDLVEYLTSMEKIKNHFKKYNVKIFNAGIGGFTDTFPRVDYNSLFD
jgi:hypothetical protein